MNRAFVYGCMLAAVLMDGAATQEWARFRGPGGQGIGVADLPTEFSAEHVRWRVEVGGAGHSSPVLWSSRVYLTRIGARRGTREVVCYDAKSGEEIWSHTAEFDDYKQHKLNSFASATPAVDERGIYLMWSSGENLVAFALDHDGELLWRRKLGGYYAQHGSGNSPVLHGELVVIANENEGEDCFLVAVNRQSGEEVWREPLAKSPRWACYSPPFLYEPEDGKPVMLVASAAHGLTAFEPENGKVRWRANPGFKNRFIAAPCLAGDRLLVNTGSGGSGKECVVFALDAGASKEPSISYRHRRGLPYVPSAIALDGRFFLFADGGFASCLEAGSGRELWRERVEGKFFSSPVSNGKAIYICDREGRLWTFSKEKFEVLGSFDLGAPVCATPALALGAMYVRTAEELICLGPEGRK